LHALVGGVMQQLVLWSVEASLGVRGVSTAVLAADVPSRDDVRPGMRWMQPLLCAASEATMAMVAYLPATTSRRLFTCYSILSEYGNDNCC